MRVCQYWSKASVKGLQAEPSQYSFVRNKACCLRLESSICVMQKPANEGTAHNFSLQAESSSTGAFIRLSLAVNG